MKYKNDIGTYREAYIPAVVFKDRIVQQQYVN